MQRSLQIIQPLWVCLLVSLIGNCSLLAYAQAQATAPAVVTFTVDFPASQPEHYSIRVQSDGTVHYQSAGRLSAASSETDTFELDCTVTPETRKKIFELAAKAGYFQKDLDSHKNVAFTGKKTLSYKDASRSGEATYNYSPNAAVTELTSLMESLSTTLEFGHRLEWDHQYQKLALDEELKSMESLARSNELVEIAAIRSILEKIVADKTVMNVTRARAQRLLASVSPQ